RPCYPPFSPLVSVSDMMRANAAIRVLLFHRQGRLSSEPQPPRLTARTSPRGSWLHHLDSNDGAHRHERVPDDSQFLIELDRDELSFLDGRSVPSVLLVPSQHQRGRVLPLERHLQFHASAPAGAEEGVGARENPRTSSSAFGPAFSHSRTKSSTR